MATKTAAKRRQGKKMRQRRVRSVAAAETASRADTVPGWGVPAGLLAWSLLVQWVYLQGDLLWHRPVSVFFFADGVHFLEQARHLASGDTVSSGLPFHPPLVPWLLVPLWWLFSTPETVYAASKVLMALCNALTVGLLYRLLHGRIPHAGWFCALLPLSFGELMLGAVANSEAVYRLLVVMLFGLGARHPALSGVVHAAASLTRAEHLPFALLAAAWGLWRPTTRRRTALTAAVGLALLLPYAIKTSFDLRSYNQRHADELPAPLPTVVPVSFYGPLNFALAQTEDDIFFSRRSLPVSGEDAALDPRHPIHNRYIVHGYAVGLRAILDQPGRFVVRAWRKLGVSMHGLAHGWTWRDAPKGRTWTRPPVDMAYATAWVYEGVVWVLIGFGLWTWRGRSWFPWWVMLLIGYRLAINVAFFPYLRSMAIVAPLTWAAAWSALAWFLRRWTRPCAIVALLLLGGFHLVTGPWPRRYLVAGERDAQGTIIDDRTVRLRWDGFQEAP